MDPDRQDRRRHLRCTVYEPCRVEVKGREFDGAVVNMSVGGAAIQLELHLEVQLATDTPVALFIERIGRIPAKVMHPLTDGFAVEFRIDRDQGQRLVAALKQVLDDYPLEDG